MIKLSIKAIATNRNQSIGSLAIDCGISPSHLRCVQNGKAKMTALDIKLLSETTNIPIEFIQVEY